MRMLNTVIFDQKNGGQIENRWQIAVVICWTEAMSYSWENHHKMVWSPVEDMERKESDEVIENPSSLFLLNAV